jgi:ElaB/YqjD/DUF883 family membrane-anchored ribosome-binding protein
MQTTTDIPSAAADAASRIERLSNGAHATVDRVATAMAEAARRLGTRRDQLMVTGQQLTDSSRHTVCRHPVAAVALAVAAGILISRLGTGNHRHPQP